MFVTSDDLCQGLKGHYKDKGRFSAAYAFYEPDASQKGWLIRGEGYIFAIGNISNNEIAKLADEKFANVVKCKDFKVKN